MKLATNMNFRRFLLFSLVSLLTGSTAFAAWHSLQAMPAATAIPHGVEYRNAQGEVRITVVRAGVIRVRFAPGRLGRDHSYAVVEQSSDVPFQFTPGSAGVDRLSTAAVVVEIQRNPFRIRFLAPQGGVLDADTSADGIAFNGARVQVWKELRPEDHFYGFGEKAGPFDKRGVDLDGTQMTMWNSDTPGYNSGTDPIYDDIPFFMVLRHGVAHGIFFDNTFRSSFDIGKSDPASYDFGAMGGELNYYFIAGPAPRDVLRRYRDLTGPMPLPPLWSLGYQQCRYSYYPDAEVRRIASTFRADRIPADGIWFDIHYMRGYRVFTWNHHRFPHPRRLLGYLHGLGFHTVTITDPGIKKDPNYFAYRSGVRNHIFATLPNGNIFIGPVWPGDAAFPDFTNPRARDWWGRQIDRFAAAGVDGIWNDMNEPSVFNTPFKTMPNEVRFFNAGQPGTAAEDHNVFGQQMSRATHDALLRLRPDVRPFVLTRATYAGGQKYAAVWTGDNVADWSHLRHGVTTLLGMGISGYPFVGNDIGGFMGVGNAELWTRWVEAGAFFPFMRAHAVFGAPHKEPWAYGPVYEAFNRKAIERRYEFLPYIYNAFHNSSRTGMPMMRALFLQYPQDRNTYAISDEYLFGADLLVAPVLSPNTAQRSVYLPAGSWFDLSGQRFNGGHAITVRAAIDQLPLFVRDGSILFRSPVIQNTNQWPTAPLIFQVFSSGPTQRDYYEDDGISFAYRRGVYEQRRLTYAPGMFTIAAPRGSYRSHHAAILVEVHPGAPVRAVTLNGQPLQTALWSFDNGLLTMRVPDTPQPLTLRWQ